MDDRKEKAAILPKRRSTFNMYFAYSQRSGFSITGDSPRSDLSTGNGPTARRPSVASLQSGEDLRAQTAMKDLAWKVSSALNPTPTECAGLRRFLPLSPSLSLSPSFSLSLSHSLSHSRSTAPSLTPLYLSLYTHTHTPSLSLSFSSPLSHSAIILTLEARRDFHRDRSLGCHLPVSKARGQEEKTEQRGRQQCLGGFRRAASSSRQAGHHSQPDPNLLLHYTSSWSSSSWSSSSRSDILQHLLLPFRRRT